MKTLDLVRRLDPAAAGDPVRAVAPGSREDMLTRIMHTPVAEGDAVGARARRRFPARRLVPVLVAAGLIGGIAISAVGLPGGTRQEALSPALSFTTEGKFLKVTILDPEADSQRYNEEFKAHHLDIELLLIPASPSRVGVADGQMYWGDDKGHIDFHTMPAGCQDAGTYPCVPEFTIPLNYKGSVRLGIGRAAKPGEQFGMAGPLNGRGEPLEGMKWLNQPVGKIAAVLKERGYTVTYAVRGADQEQSGPVPPNWYVVEPSVLEAGKRVSLGVSPTPMR
jgi:hypothetical protein